MTGGASSAPTEVKLIREGPVAVIALDRPAKRNAVTLEMQRELAAAFATVAADKTIGAVVLTGSGTDFCVGGDRAVLRQLEQEPGFTRQATDHHRRTVAALLALEIPVIGAVEGAAFGFGAELVAACDVVIMGEGARLADPHVPLGLPPAPLVALVWPQQTSRLVASELILSGREVAAQEAVRLGLANRAVSTGTARAEALALARTLADLPVAGITTTKRVLRLELADLERFYPAA